MKIIAKTLEDYFAFLLSEADAAYWLNRRVTIAEVIKLWTKVIESGFCEYDEKFIRIRSGYPPRMVVKSVREDRTMWLRLLMSFVMYRKKVNNTERKIYLTAANHAWEIYVKTQADMLRFKMSINKKKIVC